MKLKPFTVLIPWLLVLFATVVEAKALAFPTIQVVPIQDSATEREYELYIKLPEHYDTKADNKYPVIYIVDALWNIEVISGSIEYFIDNVILVGISWEKGLPPQQSRMRDYTPIPYRGTKFPHPTGKADEHLAFLKHDVFKYVESQYKADPKNRSFYGFSVGGTFGSYILLTQPNTFKNYILGSPATLFGGQFIHEQQFIKQKIPESIDANVFVSVGSEEKLKEIEHAISLVHFLKSNKANSPQVEFKVIESADHGRAFPISAIQSLIWLAAHSK